ncbi:MAG: DNA mismatch repair endonuclease MutL [Desulfomicrobium escambiense]|nr:DNA mismatch repair endonuclease MutL [Desulfomicrobium escambiense]
MIAAGGVVERPASVVKELLENALDAGSTKIEIDIARAGKGLIRVADNGGGMDRDDALLAFQRYATSKIGAVEDLFRIRTLGFRGEALSSIASVSRECGFITALPGQTGTLIESDGGETKDLRDHPATGTIVEVRDLFSIPRRAASS